jgi:hypothetical protein
MSAADDRDLRFACLWATALALAVALFDGGLVRTLLGLPMALLIAGHAPLRALGVRTETVGQHVIYAVGASFAVGILGGFVLNALGRLTPGGWAMWYWTATVAASVVVARRGAAPPLPALPLPEIRRGHLVAGLVAACMTTGAYALAVRDETTQQQFKYTEFWLLPEATGSGFELGIRSGESKPMRFDLELAVDGKPFARIGDIDLAPGRLWTRAIEAPAPATDEKEKDPEREKKEEALRAAYGLKASGPVEEALRERFSLGATDRLEEALRARIGPEQAAQIVLALREQRADPVPRKAEAKLYREDGRLYRHVTAILPTR